MEQSALQLILQAGYVVKAVLICTFFSSPSCHGRSFSRNGATFRDPTRRPSISSGSTTRRETRRISFLRRKVCRQPPVEPLPVRVCRKDLRRPRRAQAHAQTVCGPRGRRSSKNTSTSSPRQDRRRPSSASSGRSGAS
ncbi:MAG: hypothetical protein MZV64_71350 [Ignavibacteriales bacterium]|nr:hypothetical protein [Ignavibacteriales bacterium]